MHREDFFTEDWETPCPMDLKPVLQSIVSEYALPLGGLHGVFHWARVLEIGLRLSAWNGISFCRPLNTSPATNVTESPLRTYSRCVRGLVVMLR